MASTRFITESGTLYRIDYGPGSMRWLIRIRPDDSGELRRDGEAIEILSCSSIEVGEPMLFMLLMDSETGLTTMRTTTPVVSYWTSGLEEPEWRGGLL